MPQVLQRLRRWTTGVPFATTPSRSDDQLRHSLQNDRTKWKLVRCNTALSLSLSLSLSFACVSLILASPPEVDSASTRRPSMSCKSSLQDRRRSWPRNPLIKMFHSKATVMSESSSYDSEQSSSASSSSILQSCPKQRPVRPSRFCGTCLCSLSWKCWFLLLGALNLLLV